MIDDVAYLVLAHAAGATRSPEEAIHVLNVLPTYRAPSVLAAALSRGFHEFCPSRAIKHGLGLALLPHYPFYMLFDNLSDTLEAAGARGDLPTIELLWKLAGPSTPGRQVWADGFGFIAEALWLLDHMSLFTPETDEQQSAFADICMDALHATPFTLDFVDTIFPDLDLAARLPAPGQQAFDCLMEQFWWCRYTNTPIASLLPLKPSILGSLLNSSSTVALEWWLQAHLAAGHALVFPADDKLFDIYSTDKGSFCWMCDVISTRKIPVFSESDSGVVPHSLPSMSYDI
ncbi:hypothetical protein BC828DRAFT_414592 [Blastocladiella britannica]|nr:hypothetical protein BC828DRAFT_414592 [Blastocladiella britannica]